MSTSPVMGTLHHQSDLSADASHKTELLKQLDLEALEEAYQKNLRMVLEEFPDIFAMDSSELERTTLVQHEYWRPPHFANYHIGHHLLYRTKQEFIQKMLEQGIIKSSNKSVG